FVAVHPGENYRYRYNIPATEPAGAYWYHGHFHGQTSPQTRSGMAGAMIVEGGLDANPAYRKFGRRVLVIQKTALGKGVTLPPGARREVLVRGGPAGSTPMIAVPFSQFVGPAPVQETLATVVSRGRSVRDRLPPKPVAHLTDLRRFRVDHRHDIVYTQDLSTD